MSWLRQSSRPIIIHTDGSCLRNPNGAGGWAAVIVQEGVTTELFGGEPDTTNNRMEMLAVVKSLQSLPGGSNVYLFTDSQYVQKGILYWVPRWKRQNWKTSADKPVLNQDLWELMDIENNRHMVSWQWVKGHNGDKNNSRCDELAYQAALSIQSQG